MQLFLQTKRGLALFLGTIMMIMLAGCGADSVFDNNVKGSGLTVDVKPADGTTNVFLNTDITGTFNKDIQQATLIEGTTFYLLDPNDNMVAGSWSYLNKVLRFKPDANLTANTTYRFVTTNGIRGTDYSRLGGDVVTTFTTGTGLGLTVTLNPQHGDTNVSLNPNITATFNEPIDFATVTNNSFYLLDSLSAKVPVTKIEHTDDNATVILKLASNLAPFSTYTTVVTTDVSAPNGHTLAANEQAMFVTGNWLRLAVSINPPDGATNVPINTMITASFNKPMDLSTLNSGNIYLMDENGTHVPGTLHTATDANGNTVVTFILEPGTTLAPNSDYTFVVENDVTSLDGEQLGTDETSTFTTGTQTELQVYIVPADGETGVAVTDNIVAYFNEDVNDTTLDGTTFYLENNVSGVLPGAISYDGANYIAVFNPDANLTAYTTYTFTVTTGVEAVNGDTLASDESSTFTTGNLIRVIDAAVFSMGSNAVAVDTNESALNGVTGNLLGTNISLGVDGVQGLASATINYEGLVAALAGETNSTTVQELVDSNVSLTTLLQIISDQMPAGPGKDAVDQIAQAVADQGLDQPVSIGELLQFPDSVLPGGVQDVLDMAGVSAAEANVVSLLGSINGALAPITESVIEIPLSIPGLTDGSSMLRAQLVSPPAIALMVEGDTIRASQARIQLKLALTGSALTDLLSLLGLGTGEILNLPLYIVLGAAEGNLTTLSVNDVAMAVQNGLASIYLGTIPDDQFFSDQPLTVDSFAPVDLINLLGLATVTAKAYAVGDANNTTMHFLPVNVPQMESAFAPLGDTTGSLLGTLTSNLEVQVTLLGIPLLDVSSLVGALSDLLVNTLAPALSPILNMLSDALGAYSGQADVTMLSLIEHYIVQP
ncbi:Ig-like domain-containing protein [Sulfurimonas sp. HSL1-2]|uniref:Ig-like domain-containing protein n=1 Tax=Thiomicrolovo zhangzhouensis TaxID=3131933 RepID=UPI0031F94955